MVLKQPLKHESLRSDEEVLQSPRRVGRSMRLSLLQFLDGEALRPEDQWRAPVAKLGGWPALAQTERQARRLQQPLLLLMVQLQHVRLTIVTIGLIARPAARAPREPRHRDAHTVLSPRTSPELAGVGANERRRRLHTTFT
eukprot:scaffold8611_cov108-Isochrysis_galbana.AAC.3